MSKNFLPAETEYLCPNARPKLRSSLDWLAILNLFPSLDSFVEWLSGFYVSPNLHSSLSLSLETRRENVLNSLIGLSLEARRENILDSLAEWLAEGGANYDVYAYLDSKLSLDIGIGCNDVLASAIGLALETKRDHILNGLINLNLETRKENILASHISVTQTMIETRYMRSNTQTINGLLAHVLGTSQSSNIVYSVVGSNGSVTFAVDVAIRHSDNSETAVGTKVAQATHNQAFASGVFEIDGTWAISPAQSMIATDSIVVRVYGKIGSGSWSLLRTFSTEQLGASELDAATWTIHYFGYEIYLPKTNTSTYSFYFGTSTYNSRIENFAWVKLVED